MNILIITGFGQHEMRSTVEHIPRIGEAVDMFYKPAPVVKTVLNYPSDDTLKSIGVSGKFAAIIMVE